MISCRAAVHGARRECRDGSGFVVGPIIWVVGVLAVIAGAFAASMGSFGSQTESDVMKVVADSIIQQGSDLETALGRLMINGTDQTSVIVSQDLTGATTPQKTEAIYSSSGGGITPRNPPPNAVPSESTMWDFVMNGVVDNVGSGANFIGVLPLKGQTVCLAINGLIFGSSSSQATAATIPTLSTGPTLNDVTAPLGVVNISNIFDAHGVTPAGSVTGRTHACVKQGTNYFYYRVLLAQ